MTSRIIITLILCLTCSILSFGQWKLIYEHDEKGIAIKGEKKALIEAIRQGKELRVGWKMGGGARTVEHFANVQFVSVLEGEVFGQISQIIAQAPSFDKKIIDFIGNARWSMIASTTGKNATILLNTENPEKKFESTYLWGNQWFIKE